MSNEITPIHVSMEKLTNIADFDQNLAIHSETSKSFSVFFPCDQPSQSENDRFSRQFI